MSEAFTLGGLTPAAFLRRHWQKKPLLARGALPECAGIVDRATLSALAGRDDLESRLVQRMGRRWTVRYGPFKPRELGRLPRAGWTLLVQGVDHALPAAQKLLERFAFIPYARLDDLMVSYAPPGGGVGPHFDSYDVFLLQGEGRRRWRVSRQRDLALVAGAPLKILRHFRPTQEWELQTGDLLYLPPRCAHEGVALTDCMTYSIGFRAPGAQELGSRFLEFLQDELHIEGIYEDPGLRPTRRPAWLADDMVRRMRGMLRRIRWTNLNVVRFLGEFLTEPKDHVRFIRPHRPLSKKAFAVQAARRGVRLAGPTRMLFRDGTIYINGESDVLVASSAQRLSRLADRRRLAPFARVDRDTLEMLYQWYRAGYLTIGDE
ncbi:MAG TPA: cupin domain-containing protein [Burkholderiales bacterium]|nr:cupin domain-containing protein [Burkholderiales bacterium]